MNDHPRQTISKVELRTALHLPRWALLLYAAVALALAPWIIYLSITLPRRHVVTHWDIAWAGFDCILLLSIVCTVATSIRRSAWFILACTATATLLIIDAWFDILTAHAGKQFMGSILFAGLAEIPLAIISLLLTIRVSRRIFAQSKSIHSE